MSKIILRAFLLGAMLALVGCGRGQVDTSVDTTTRLGDQSEQVGDLGKLLQIPRSELAGLLDEQNDYLAKQLEGFQNQNTGDLLLAKLKTPTTLPIFRLAKYNEQRGISLPPYAKTADVAVAVHVARHGDYEAAVKLAGAHTAVEALKGEKNYPLEWSRLIALKQIIAQNKLAIGDLDGAAEIVAIHKQLVQLLDEKSAKGPLGAVLLPAGRRALAQAAKAFRESRWNKPTLADDLDKALEEWGQTPTVSVLGMRKDEAIALFGSSPRGLAFVAEDLDRARDLLALAVPTEGVQAIFAHLDTEDKVGAITIAYRGKLTSLYPENDHLAYYLDDAGIPAKDETKSTGVTLTVYNAADRYEIARCNRSLGVGALVRISGSSRVESSVPRELGAIHFDRGFEANRLGWIPAGSGTAITVESKDALSALVNGTNVPVPVVASIQKADDGDLLQALRLSWTADTNAAAAGQLLPALASFGPATIDGTEDATGASLRLRWQGAKQSAELRLPYDEKPAVLSITDIQQPQAKAERLKLAKGRDEAERKARFEAGKPHVRLERSPGAVNNESSLAQIRLGQARTEVLAALPKNKMCRTKEVPGGVTLLFLSSPDEPVPHWASQVLVRFGDDKVSEIRVRYNERLAPAKKGETLLEKLSDAKSGSPERLRSAWVDLWADLPARDPKPALYRWQDDRTVRTYQADASGSELVWRDRDTKVQPWLFLSRGPKDMQLGGTREQVEKSYKFATVASGATVYRAADKSPYEMYMVWYKNDVVERVIAVHRGQTGVLPEEVTGALQKAWGQNFAEFGALRRKEGKRGAVLGAYYWHDDATRIRTFVQLDDNARVMTEWRGWPKTTSDTTSTATK